jgi:hypothetical protein
MIATVGASRTVDQASGYCRGSPRQKTGVVVTAGELVGWLVAAGFVPLDEPLGVAVAWVVAVGTLDAAAVAVAPAVLCAREVPVAGGRSLARAVAESRS